MPKRRRRYGSNFYIDKKSGKSFVRVQIPTGERDAKGNLKYRNIREPAENQTDADEIAARLYENHKRQGTGMLTGREMTFADLADWYEREFAVAPVYVDGKLIAGIRSWSSVRRMLSRLKVEFAPHRIINLNEDVLRRFRLKRLTKDKVAIATVNRDMELIRAMLNRAFKRKWLSEVPDFSELMLSGERVREVVIDQETEEKLLNAARQLKTSVLYYLIIALHDTGARPSELMNYRAGAEQITYEPPTWEKFFAGKGETLELVSFKGKDRKTRLVPVSARLNSALWELWERETNPQPADLIFKITSVERAWQKDKKLAGLESADIRLRDLRRSFRTRLEKANYPAWAVQRIMGHTTVQQSYDYLGIDMESILSAKVALDSIKTVDAESQSVN